jgi:hypothetical protein
MEKYDLEKERSKAETEAKSVIERNGGKVGDATIKIANPGIGVLGAIDCLVNHMKYTWDKS